MGNNMRHQSVEADASRDAEQPGPARRPDVCLHPVRQVMTKKKKIKYMWQGDF